jgi:DNA-directed RNA polymerase specialized sigma24 family protein
VTAVPSATRGDGPGLPRLTARAADDAREVACSLREPERFGIIFDRYFAEIHQYIARRLGSDAADDIAAETFLTAFRKRRRFDAERGIVRAWLYGIATNDMSRYQRRELRAGRAMARTGVPPPDEGHADREVVLLVALGGLSHAEVAAALGIPYGTVGSRLSRARRKLRAALGETGPARDEENNGHG